MGWNDVLLSRADALFDGIAPAPRFYFVHSYHFACDTPQDILTTTEYGVAFVSAFRRGNIYGVQFHPEKSHVFGMKLFANFARL